MAQQARRRARRDLFKLCGVRSSVKKTSQKADSATAVAYVLMVQQKHGITFETTHSPRPHVVALLSFVLYTMQDVDIDRFWGFEDVPGFPRGKESPAERDEVYKGIQGEAQAPVRTAQPADVRRRE